MKFKVDENLPSEIAADLRATGHDADTVYDQGLVGAIDTAIMARVQAENRVMLTMDKGIADVRVYPPGQYAGIVLFRPALTGRNAVLTFVRQHLPVLLTGSLAGHLFIISEAGVRVR